MTASPEIAQKSSQVVSGMLKLGFTALLLLSVVLGFGFYNRFEVSAALKLLNFLEFNVQAKPSQQQQPEPLFSPAPAGKAENL